MTNKNKKKRIQKKGIERKIRRTKANEINKKMKKKKSKKNNNEKKKKIGKERKK